MSAMAALSGWLKFSWASSLGDLLLTPGGPKQESRRCR